MRQRSDLVPAEAAVAPEHGDDANQRLLLHFDRFVRLRTAHLEPMTVVLLAISLCAWVETFSSQIICGDSFTWSLYLVSGSRQEDQARPRDRETDDVVSGMAGFNIQIDPKSHAQNVNARHGS